VLSKLTRAGLIHGLSIVTELVQIGIVSARGCLEDVAVRIPLNAALRLNLILEDQIKLQDLIQSYPCIVIFDECCVEAASFAHLLLDDALSEASNLEVLAYLRVYRDDGLSYSHTLALVPQALVQLVKYNGVII
jgi:hypothetical protein